MIQPSEYRIGNIVCWNPALTNPGNTLPRMEVEIASIAAGKIGYFSPNLDHRVEAFQDDLLQTEPPFKSIDELEPLPLTQEIADQAGFINNMLGLTISGQQHYLIFSENEIHYQHASGHPLSLAMKYLHQLQNLYFALTGEELKIDIFQ